MRVVKPIIGSGDCEHCKQNTAVTTTVWLNPETMRKESIRVCGKCVLLIRYCIRKGVRMTPKRLERDSVYLRVSDPIEIHEEVEKNEHNGSLPKERDLLPQV